MIAIPTCNRLDGSRYITYEQMNLINEFRLHSLEYAMWSRALANALKFQTESIEAVYERLLREPADIYRTARNFYGPEISEQYLNYLTQQVINFRNLTEALINNDHLKADESWRNWNRTAEQIAEFLARINPYWERAQWVQLLQEYHLMVYYEILAILSGDYGRGIDIFDRVVDHTIIMADYMSRGLMMNLVNVSPEASPPAQTGDNPAV